MTSLDLSSKFPSLTMNPALHLPQLSKFDFFPNLAPELRLKIMRIAHPMEPHSASLELCCIPDRSIRHEDGTKELSAGLKSKFPITLWINKETRAETQKHYTVLWPADAEIPRTARAWTILNAPVVVNPQIDGIELPVHHDDLSPSQFEQWLNYVDTQIPGGFNSIRKLRLTNIFWKFKRVNYYNVCNFWNVQERAGRNPFSGLEKLTVFIHFEEEDEVLENEMLLDAGEVIEKFLKSREETFDSGKVPKVFVVAGS